MDRPQSEEQVQSSYDRVASQYALNLFNELEGKPIDREMLDAFAERLRRKGTVCDVGCGPGHVACYLWRRGLAEVCGLDLSPAMIETARSLNPEIPFMQGDLMALDIPDGAWAGATAFYAFVNLSRSQLPAMFAELHRALQPSGLLLALEISSLFLTHNVLAVLAEQAVGEDLKNCIVIRLLSLAREFVHHRPKHIAHNKTYNHTDPTKKEIGKHVGTSGSVVEGVALLTADRIVLGQALHRMFALGAIRVARGVIVETVH